MTSGLELEVFQVFFPPKPFCINDSMLPLLCIQIALILQQQEGFHSNCYLFTEDVTELISLPYVLRISVFEIANVVSSISAINACVGGLCFLKLSRKD